MSDNAIAKQILEGGRPTGNPGSRVIASEDVQDLKKWQMPDMATGTAGPQSMLTAGGMEKIQKQAYEEGFAQGRQAGLVAAQADVQTLLSGLEPAHKDVDDSMVQELTELAITIARQLVRRELHADPGEIIHIVQEAVTQLPTVSQGVIIHLHPEDAAILRETTATSGDAEQRLSIIEDASMTRGDCRVSTDTSTIDSSLENRLNAVVSKMLGGEREDDANDHNRTPV